MYTHSTRVVLAYIICSNLPCFQALNNFPSDFNAWDHLHNTIQTGPLWKLSSWEQILIGFTDSNFLKTFIRCQTEREKIPKINQHLTSIVECLLQKNTSFLQNFSDFHQHLLQEWNCHACPAFLQPGKRLEVILDHLPLCPVFSCSQFFGDCL